MDTEKASGWGIRKLGLRFREEGVGINRRKLGGSRGERRGVQRVSEKV